MTSNTRGQVKIEYESDMQKSKDRIFDLFKQADFTDCKINAFPYNTEHTSVDMQIKNKTASSFIMIDLDLKDFQNNKEKLDKQFKKTLKNLSIKFHGESYPTVLWTGNGYHFYQPIEGMVFEKYQKFYDFLSYIDSKNLTTEFLRFAENLFTKGKADPNHRPSIKSCLVRVPGTSNSKNGQQVQVIQRWDGKRPVIQWVTHDFKTHLIQKRIDKIKEKKKDKDKKLSFNKHDIYNSKIGWIENLLQTPIEDYRKQCLWRILIPYLVNIRKLSIEESTRILKEWLQKCDQKSHLDFYPDIYIKNGLRNVRKFKPQAKEKLKNEHTELYQLLRTRNILLD
jgi:non-catalytic primase subunit PriX-like protein